jgi:hypothetical protein
MPASLDMRVSFQTSEMMPGGLNTWPALHGMLCFQPSYILRICEREREREGGGGGRREEGLLTAYNK